MVAVNAIEVVQLGLHVSNMNQAGNGERQ